MLHLLLGICAVYSGMCLLFLVINLLAVPRLSRARPAGPGAPFVSIVVPARNEERGIGAAVQAFLSQRYPSFEVVVVDDRSTDRTLEILRGFARDPRLRIIEGVEPPAGWLGKPHALYQGARAAKGELLLFVDADIRYEPEALSLAVGDLTEHRADLLVLLPRFESGSFWEEVLMPNLVCTVFFGPAFLINARRPRWLAGGGGSGNLVRRSVYEAVGGHEALRSSVVDDVRLGAGVKAAGYRLRVTLAHDRIAVRMYEGFREVWNGFTKNVAYAFSGWFGAFFLTFSLFWTFVAIAPPVLLLGAALGASLPEVDVIRAAVSVLLLFLARVILSIGLK